MRDDFSWLFFFQAEDGIRDIGVTGVQTCALPILLSPTAAAAAALLYHAINAHRLAWSGRRLGAAGAAIIVGAPYAVGILLLLQTEPLVRSEERRVGKECRSLGARYQTKTKTDVTR